MQIVCGVHSPQRSRNVARTAGLLARATGGDLELVHVMQGRAVLAPRSGVGESLPWQSSGMGGLVAAAEAMLEAVADDVERATGAAVRTRVMTGFPAARLRGAAIDAAADVLVLGVSARGGWRRRRRVARAVARRPASWPLLLVPERDADSALDAVALRFPDTGWPAAPARLAARLAAEAGVELQLLPASVAGWRTYDVERRMERITDAEPVWLDGEPGPGTLVVLGAGQERDAAAHVGRGRSVLVVPDGATAAMVAADRPTTFAGART